MLKDTSTQAEGDLTINTEAAADFGGTVPPADSYEGPDSADDLLVDDVEVPGSTGVEMATDETATTDETAEKPAKSPKNEELIAADLAANANEQTPIEQKVSEFSLNNIRDAEWLRNTVVFFMLLGGMIGYNVQAWWLSACFKADTLWKTFLAWCGKQQEKFELRWNERFPPKATKDDLIILARAIANAFKADSDKTQTSVDRLAMRVSTLERVLKGTEPQHCSAATLDEFVAALQGGKKLEAAKLRSALTGEKLTASKAAIENYK